MSPNSIVQNVQRDWRLENIFGHISSLIMNSEGGGEERRGEEST